MVQRARHSVLPDPDAPVVLPTPATAKAHGRRLYVSPRSLVTVAGLLLLLVPIALIVFRALHDDRIYPAIVVGDVPVGGLTMFEAEERLTQRTAGFEDQVVVFSLGDRTWTPRLRDLGATVDVAGSLARAQGMGRSGDAASRLAFTGAILTADQRIPLQVNLDPDVLAAWFDAVDRDIGQPAIDATLVIDGTQVTVTPDATGTVVDREAATRLIREALAEPQPGNLDLPTRVAAPAITTGDLDDAEALARQVLAAPVAVTWEDQQWSIDPTVISRYLVVETALDGNSPAIGLTINPEQLATNLRAGYGHLVQRAPVDAIIGWEGKAVVLEPGQNGATLDPPAFARLVAASFLGGHEPVAVPVVAVLPAITGDEIDTMGIDTLLGEGHSNYSNSVDENRDENVRVGTRYLNATLVPPGGIFSFNDAIGEITYERGFVESSVVQEGVGRDVGGGVCQVSTTIFRAALNAGMPITEWYPHTYRLANYELDDWGPGFDASILQFGPDPAAWPDFEFENYTSGWLLIEASTSYPYVNVRIYGTGDGRSVAIEPFALGGNAFGFTRTIYDASGNVIAERHFESYYL
jgi:vancomycin resistance protein YoaR